MKFGVLALDYDGTIARDGALDPGVRAAIGEARARGIAVLIVTGRILSELKQVTGGLNFVDAVVAENGAVLWFPNGYSRLLGTPASPRFLEELKARGLEFKAGQCVVELDAGTAPQVLDIIRTQELPLVLLFNRGRLMVLPQAVSKGVGLREALATLRASTHNAIGIGDAENDHDLLTSCELGVAVSWGIRLLQAVAGEVLEGNGPPAVAGYIRRMAKELRLPPDRIGRHYFTLGSTEEGHDLTLPIRGHNELIAGDPRSGKSWVTGLICEQLILQGYSVCIIDPEGDYRTLETLPGVVVFGGEDPLPELPDLARVLRHPDMSVILDLCRASYEEKMNYMKSLLPMLAATRRASGLPHRIVIDEAHYFLHEPNARELLDLALGAYTLVTYRMSDLHPNLRSLMETIIVKRTTEPRELRSLLGMPGARANGSINEAVLATLPLDEAVLLPGPEGDREKSQKIKLYPRLTSHVRHKAKYLDVQLLAEQGFVFTNNGEPVGHRSRTLKEFVYQLASSEPEVIAGHARRGDFSRWIAEVFRDHALASEIRKLEMRFRLGHIEGIANPLARLVQGRYDVSPETVPAIQEVDNNTDGEDPGGLGPNVEMAAR